MSTKKTTLQKGREKMQAELADIPTEVLEAEMERRSASARQIKDLVVFLQDAPDGGRHYGDDITFSAETLIDFMKRNWHTCLISGVAPFDDVEKWLRRIIFGKEDGRKKEKR